METARALAAAGASVWLAVRDLAADITRSTANQSVSAQYLDLADLASIRTLASSWQGPLDIPVNNAGITNTPGLRTAQGWELQFTVNHLGHFALATELHHALARRARRG